jgi:polyhydroxybutyrate depolymerase
MKYFFPALFLFVLSVNANAQTSILGSIMHDGLERGYRLYVPLIYDGTQAVPLVLNLHGYTSNAFEQEVYGSFRAIADTANFIVVHPEGTLDNTQSQYWNAFNGQGGPDDVGFLSALIDSISSEYSIDLNCVYSTGMSNGGFMTYKLGCELGHRIAAIASVTGTMVQAEVNACDPDHPTPALHVHGTADPTVPYLGSAPQTMVSVQSVVDFWASHNNCNMTPTETAVPDINMTDGCTTDHFVYGDGDLGSTVELYRVNGGGHTWPGSPTFITIGVTSQDFSASVEIWRFFRQYKLNDLNTGIKEGEKKGSVQVYPNPSNGSVSIRFETSGLRTIELHDPMGRKLTSVRSTGTQHQLEIEGSGLFLLSVIAEQGIHTERLIIN